MPHALLLSPDDQAVSAITGVLEEMSVTCERPLDGVSAAHKLNAQTFDLVLVDCENLPAAKLIFDVCRRGKNGHNPVPIAIVDGRAGLPTAFRLGAELILTKPVAKDQARTTIRTAVSRVRKEAPATETLPVSLAATPIVASGQPQVEELALAAAASGSPMPVASSVPTLAAHTVLDQISAPASSAPTSAPDSTRMQPRQISDDPVLADLELAELDSAAGLSTKSGSPLEKSRLEAATPDALVLAHKERAADSPVLSSYPKQDSKGRGPLVALFLLMVATAGFYAAWTYQPEFRTIAQAQIDHLMGMAGLARPASSVQPVVSPSQAKPSAASIPATLHEPALPAPGAPANPKGSSALTAAAPVAAQIVAPAITTSASAPAPVTAIQSDTGNGNSKKALDSIPAGKPAGSVATTAPVPSTAPLPDEASAIILSSKGAEKRLAHSVPPSYPVDAAAGDAQGTVVLKEIVDENGVVKGIRLVEGNPALANAAMQAVRQWRYRPYVRDGKTLPFQTVVIVDFQRP
jgi:protein TonB